MRVRINLRGVDRLTLTHPHRQPILQQQCPVGRKRNSVADVFSQLINVSEVIGMRLEQRHRIGTGQQIPRSLKQKIKGDVLGQPWRDDILAVQFKREDSLEAFVQHLGPAVGEIKGIAEVVAGERERNIENAGVAEFVQEIPDVHQHLHHHRRGHVGEAGEVGEILLGDGWGCFRDQGQINGERLTAPGHNQLGVVPSSQFGQVTAKQIGANREIRKRPHRATGINQGANATGTGCGAEIGEGDFFPAKRAVSRLLQDQPRVGDKLQLAVGDAAIQHPERNTRVEVLEQGLDLCRNIAHLEEITVARGQAVQIRQRQSERQIRLNIEIKVDVAATLERKPEIVKASTQIERLRQIADQIEAEIQRQTLGATLLLSEHPRLAANQGRGNRQLRNIGCCQYTTKLHLKGTSDVCAVAVLHVRDRHPGQLRQQLRTHGLKINGLKIISRCVRRQGTEYRREHGCGIRIMGDRRSLCRLTIAFDREPEATLLSGRWHRHGQEIRGMRTQTFGPQHQ